MAREFARKFYHSKEWKATRAYVFERDMGLCQRCRRMGRMTPGQIVHHVKPITPGNIDDPRVSLDPDNLELVCKECHETIHDMMGDGALHKKREEEDRVGFDSMGNVVRLK